MCDTRKILFSVELPLVCQFLTDYVVHPFLISFFICDDAKIVKKLLKRFHSSRVMLGIYTVLKVLTSHLFFPPLSEGYPSLRIEKNDLRSVTLMEAKAKVKDIAISRERVTLMDVLQEGIALLLS